LAALSEIFDALAGHSSLTKLSIEQDAVEGQQYRKILTNGWESLASLLRRPSSNLMVLELYGTLIDNLGAYILAAGILENASLKEFTLNSTQQMTLNGWDTIFAALKRSTCTLEKLKIYMNRRMEDDVLSSISNALLDNCTLKSLSLLGNGEYAPSATVANRGALMQLLHNPLCALEILDLHSVGLNNDSIISLRNVIANNSRLRE
jgi:Ran GTPase-activating protein (RanGAP) involved in mRNA processing and transport